MLLTLILLPAIGFAQLPKEQDLMLFGIVKDQRSGKPLPNAVILVRTDSLEADAVKTNEEGQYQTYVPLSGVHRVRFGAEGHHHKVVEVNVTTLMSPEDRSQEWNLRIDIDLPGDAIALPPELLDTPIGVASWIPERHAFEWDGAYTERYMVRYKKALKAAKANK